MKEGRPVQLDPSDPGEIWDHRGPWVCPALKDPADCRFQERPAARDQRENPVTQAYLDRKVHLGLLVLEAPSDQLESGDHKGRRDQPDPEAPRGPWDLQDLQESQVLQDKQESPETPVPLAPSVPKETKEREATSLLRT